MAEQVEFEWLATESAPKGYPMEVISGTLLYRGRSEGLYIPSGGTLNRGWGKGISNHVVGPDTKPLPDRLQITFFSLLENEFYQGEFELPYDMILGLFRAGVADDPTNPAYSTIMVGVAPGGAVSVWLHGRQTTEVFFGKAEKVTLEPSEAFRLPFTDKADSDQYVRENILDVMSTDELRQIEKAGIPFDLWERYRNRYAWLPVVPQRHPDSRFKVLFLNGEKDNELRLDVDASRLLRPLPKQVFFHAFVNSKKYLYIVHFDDVELMEAFEALAKQSEVLRLEFDPKVPRPHTQVRVCNSEECIPLKKALTEDW